MGLDMYLKMVPKVDSIEELDEMETRLSKAFYAGKLEAELKKIQKEKGFKKPIEYTESEWVHDKDDYIKQNEEYHSPKIVLRKECGYWRKFNALHSWFVETFQDGVDECQPSLVDPEVLKDLFDKILTINKKNAKAILPTAGGFFFGGTEYDEYYWQDIEELKKFLIHLFDGQDFEEHTLVYRASW
jgi:hypothetical protein